MQNVKPIKVKIPKLWRIAGQIFIVGGAIILFVVIALTIFPSNPLPLQDLWVALLGLVAISFTAIFLLPCFIQRYPSWVVKIFGREYLEEFISKAQAHLGENRIYSARWPSPFSWLKDQRIQWLIIICAAFCIGLYKAVG